MDEGFLNLISQIKGLNYNTLWSIFLLGFIRFGPMVSIIPFLGAKLIPAFARVGFALALTIVFLPTLLVYSTHETLTSTQFVGYSVKEVVIGFLIAYVASVPFFIAQSSGIFIDYARGASIMMGQDPTTQTQSSPIGTMLNYYLIVLFFAFDGPLLFFDAVGTSFRIVPVDAMMSATFFTAGNPFWKTMIDLLNQIFTLSIQLAAPSLLAILMAETFLGIANRLAPQVQIAFLGMPLKSLLGLTMLWAGWYYIIQKTSELSIDWMQMLNRLIHAF